jgi:recombinational DNA repair ATPase RecF
VPFHRPQKEHLTACSLLPPAQLPRKSYNLLGEAMVKDRMVQYTTVGIHKDDLVIIVAYCQLNDAEAQNHAPKIVHVNTEFRFLLK